MPLHTGKNKEGCFVRWGDQGKEYPYICNSDQSYEYAKEKALAQAIAIGDLEKTNNSFLNNLRNILKKSKVKLVASKISFDYDETLTKQNIQDIAKQFIIDGAEVYIISARQNKEIMYGIADELGISHSNIYATGSNKAKIEKIIELGIELHYDNNKDVIDQLGNIGRLVE